MLIRTVTICTVVSKSYMNSCINTTNMYLNTHQRCKFFQVYCHRTKAITIIKKKTNTIMHTIIKNMRPFRCMPVHNIQILYMNTSLSSFSCLFWGLYLDIKKINGLAIWKPLSWSANVNIGDRLCTEFMQANIRPV